MFKSLSLWYVQGRGTWFSQVVIKGGSLEEAVLLESGAEGLGGPSHKERGEEAGRGVPSGGDITVKGTNILKEWQFWKH